MFFDWNYLGEHICWVDRNYKHTGGLTTTGCNTTDIFNLSTLFLQWCSCIFFISFPILIKTCSSLLLWNISMQSCGVLLLSYFTCPSRSASSCVVVWRDVLAAAISKFLSYQKFASPIQIFLQEFFGLITIIFTIGTFQIFLVGLHNDWILQLLVLCISHFDLFSSDLPSLNFWHIYWWFPWKWPDHWPKQFLH